MVSIVFVFAIGLWTLLLSGNAMHEARRVMCRIRTMTQLEFERSAPGQLTMYPHHPHPSPTIHTMPAAKTDAPRNPATTSLLLSLSPSAAHTINRILTNLTHRAFQYLYTTKKHVGFDLACAAVVLHKKYNTLVASYPDAWGGVGLDSYLLALLSNSAWKDFQLDLVKVFYYGAEKLQEDKGVEEALREEFCHMLLLRRDIRGALMVMDAWEVVVGALGELLESCDSVKAAVNCLEDFFRKHLERARL